MYNDGTSIVMLVQSITSAACFLAGIAALAWSFAKGSKTQLKPVEDSLPLTGIRPELTRRAA